MYCSECGFLLPEKVKFCPNCGVKIETIKTIELLGMHFAFSAGRYYKLSEEYGNSFLTKAAACKKEVDSANMVARLNVDKGGCHPDGEYPRRGFEKDDQGNWVYKKYKVADIEYYPEWEITEEFEIPERIRDKYEINSICNEAFWGCKELTSVYIPDSVKYIGSSIFVDCLNVSNIRMPEEVESIGNALFWHCINLTQIKMPIGTKKIKNEFYACSKLGNIEIPDNVESISYRAFNGTSYENNGKWENNIFEYKNYLLRVSSKYKDKFVVPDRLTVICEDAFWWCENITEIIISKNVTRIEDSAFINCVALTEIIIPENVKWLGRAIFLGCDALRKVTILNPEIEMDEDMIAHWSRPKYLVIYGKEGSTVQKYAEKNKILFKVIE